MSEISINDLRRLRKQAEELNATLVTDLGAFWEDERFLRLPTSDRSETDPNPTTTCSCLMALAMAGELGAIFDKVVAVDMARTAFEKIMNDSWVSSKLNPMNAFTTTIVFRAAGLLREKNILEQTFYDTHVHLRHEKCSKEERETTKKEYKPTTEEHTFPTIAYDLWHSEQFQSFRIWTDSEVPPSLTTAYWWLDGVSRAELTLVAPKTEDKSESDNTEDTWRKFCHWVTGEFRKQTSLIAADHESFMDPIEMAMAACLCAKLHRLANQSGLGLSPDLAGSLATRSELEDGLGHLMRKQTEAGIWPKYFPLFNYPASGDKGGGGSNYCFTFEMLEAVLDSHGGENSTFLERQDVFGGLKKAVRWCRQNRLRYKYKGKSYSGWHSGGQLQTLATGQPESWATAVVHMFLWELRDALSLRIEERLLLDEYHVDRPLKKDEEVWDGLLDIHIKLAPPVDTVQALFSEDMVKPRERKGGDKLGNHKAGARSALLFGPPGTSKTSIAKALAGSLGWPLVKLDPSHFLREGLDGIYQRANDVFDNLMDLSRAVVLFDEMDALVRTRADKAGPLDMTSQFLTTCMLPKLSDLHDRGKVIFLMATNHLKSFDQAIIRPGRFDLLICVGPPTWEAKLKGLDLLLRIIRPSKTKKECEAEALAAKPILREHAKGLPKEDMLNLFTFREFKQLIASLTKDGKSLADRLSELDAAAVEDRLRDLADHAWFSPKDRGWSPDLVEYRQDSKETRRQT